MGSQMSKAVQVVADTYVNARRSRVSILEKIAQAAKKWDEHEEREFEVESSRFSAAISEESKELDRHEGIMNTSKRILGIILNNDMSEVSHEIAASARRLKK